MTRALKICLGILAIVTLISSKVIDHRLTPINKLLIDENERTPIPECDPSLPNLSVKDIVLESMNDY